MLAGGVVVPFGRSEGGRGSRERFEHGPKRGQPAALGFLDRMVKPQFDGHCGGDR